MIIHYRITELSLSCRLVIGAALARFAVVQKQTALIELVDRLDLFVIHIPIWTRLLLILTDCVKYSAAAEAELGIFAVRRMTNRFALTCQHSDMYPRQR